MQGAFETREKKGKIQLGAQPKNPKTKWRQIVRLKYTYYNQAYPCLTTDQPKNCSKTATPVAKQGIT